MILREGSKVWGAGGGGHAAVEAGACGANAHPHASSLKAHWLVEAVGDGGAHGAHHGAGGGEGSDGGALHWGWSRWVRQGKAVQRCHVVEKAAGQVLSLQHKMEKDWGCHDFCFELEIQSK